MKAAASMQISLGRKKLLRILASMLCGAFIPYVLYCHDTFLKGLIPVNLLNLWKSLHPKASGDYSD